MAVDLSRASLGYAKRKSDELGVANATYAQADILELSGLDAAYARVAEELHIKPLGSLGINRESRSIFKQAETPAGGADPQLPGGYLAPLPREQSRASRVFILPTLNHLTFRKASLPNSTCYL